MLSASGVHRGTEVCASQMVLVLFGTESALRLYEYRRVSKDSMELALSGREKSPKQT